MKHKVIFLLVLVVCFCVLPVTAFAASPAATLTIDGGMPVIYPSVQAAVDAVTANAGTNFVIEVAEGTVSDPTNITQQTGKNVVLKPQPGATVTFTNTITIDGNGNLNNPETLLIEGFIFDFTDPGSPADCIDFNLIPPHVGFSYPHNITINGCTFMGIFDQTVAVQSIPGGSRNIAIMNSTATNMHSLAQLKAVAGYAFIQNCIVNNSSGGVNFYGVGDLIIDSCVFNVEEYAVRSGQNAGVISNLGSVVINNSVLNSNTAGVGTVVLRGDSTDNINIIHSDITNNAPGGPFLQNLNAASQGLYNIDVVESNVNGEIAGILLPTITTIDDPNVENGPINITIEPENNLIIVVTVLSLIIIMLLVAFFYYIIFGQP